MKTEQLVWRAGAGWGSPLASPSALERAQLVLVFVSPALFDGNHGGLCAELKKRYPQALIFGCSTAGEIAGTNVLEGSLVATAVLFEQTTVQWAGIHIGGAHESFAAGQELASRLAPAGLRHVIILSDGIAVNGSELTRGLIARLPKGVVVTGGLAGDGERFKETFVIQNCTPEKGGVGAIGLYGDRLKIGYGSFGGWDPFGPERLITRSDGNILYELDGESALALYKRYLGDYAAGLPSTGLLFPLSIRQEEGTTSLVRTILSVDEAAQSMTFAGDVPQGSYARLMKANFDRLIDGAIRAADTCVETIGSFPPQLALLISCVGRKIVLKQRIEEEVEGVRDVFGPATRLAGFYSYGEIAPFDRGAPCELHNQTMTITVLGEI